MGRNGDDDDDDDEEAAMKLFGMLMRHGPVMRRRSKEENLFKFFKNFSLCVYFCQVDESLFELAPNKKRASDGLRWFFEESEIILSAAMNNISSRASHLNDEKSSAYSSRELCQQRVRADVAKKKTQIVVFTF